jgi:hypothetical protein
MKIILYSIKIKLNPKKLLKFDNKLKFEIKDSHFNIFNK